MFLFSTTLNAFPFMQPVLPTLISTILTHTLQELNKMGYFSIDIIYHHSCLYSYTDAFTIHRKSYICFSHNRTFSSMNYTLMELIFKEEIRLIFQVTFQQRF